MREVLISGLVWEKIAELESYLISELKLSETAALRRSARMRKFISAFSVSTDYPLCRFKRWRMLGYRSLYLKKIGFLPTKHLTAALLSGICHIPQYYMNEKSFLCLLDI